jgi:hypothetical protein
VTYSLSAELLLFITGLGTLNAPCIMLLQGYHVRGTVRGHAGCCAVQRSQSISCGPSRSAKRSSPSFEYVMQEAYVMTELQQFAACLGYDLACVITGTLDLFEADLLIDGSVNEAVRGPH